MKNINNNGIVFSLLFFIVNTICFFFCMKNDLKDVMGVYLLYDIIAFFFFVYFAKNKTEEIK